MLTAWLAPRGAWLCWGRGGSRRHPVTLSSRKKLGPELQPHPLGSVWDCTGAIKGRGWVFWVCPTWYLHLHPFFSQPLHPIISPISSPPPYFSILLFSHLFSDAPFPSFPPFPTASSLPISPPMPLSLATELHPAQPVAAHPFHPRAERGHWQKFVVDAEP